MKRFHAFLLGCAFVPAVAISSASAADLPRKAPYAPIYAPAFSWTGFYAGINGGYGWSDSFADNANGGVYGGQLGYNWQIGNFVLGLEGDFQGTTIKASQSGTTPFGTLTVEGKIPAFATVRGRIGYAWNSLLLYGTGGWAYTQSELSATLAGVTVSESAWGSGYAVGGGLEYALWDRWSVKGEYLYVKSGETTLNLGGATATADYKFNVVRAGLNYRF